MKTQTQLKKIADSKVDADVRICRRAVVGKTVLQQGDVYLHCVADDHPRGKKLGTRQVAVGTSVGARHIAKGDVEVFEGVKLPDYITPAPGVPASEYLGPVVVGHSRWGLAHPEHADHEAPDVTWQVTYQVDGLTRRRVVD